MSETSKEVSSKKSTECFEISLPSTYQIYLVFLIPSIVNCCVYVAHFAADLVVAVQHFIELNPVWGCVTLGFMYTPAIVYFILIISRPDWWMTDDDKLQKGVLLWFLQQTCKLIAFPLFALYR